MQLALLRHIRKARSKCILQVNTLSPRFQHILFNSFLLHHSILQLDSRRCRKPPRHFIASLSRGENRITKQNKLKLFTFVTATSHHCQIRFYHLLHQLIKRCFVNPPQYFLCLCWSAKQQINLCRAEVPRVYLYQNP